MAAQGEPSHSPANSVLHMPALLACFDLRGNLCNQNATTIPITVDGFRQV